MIKIQVKDGLLFGEPRCSCFLEDGELEDGEYEAETLILQDLNGSLAMKYSESHNEGKGVSFHPENDVYCPELCAELSAPNLFVTIVTARGIKYRDQTMRQLREQYPNLDIKGYVARKGADCQTYRRISDFKPVIFRALLPHVGLENILMIESNSQTHAGYVQAGGKYIVNRKEFLARGGISGFREFRERFVSRAYQT